MKLPGTMVAEVLRHVLKLPATVQYPFVKVEMPKDFRGKMLFFAEKCNGCGLCVKDCPSKALTINKTADKRGEAIFELDKCIYCGQCVDSCNRDAIGWTNEYELAALGRGVLRVKFDAAPAAAPAVKAVPAEAAPAKPVETAAAKTEGNAAPTAEEKPTDGDKKAPEGGPGAA